MSRIGKKPIAVPENVSVDLEGGFVLVKGPKGNLSQAVPAGVGLVRREGGVTVEADPARAGSEAASLRGTIRSIIANMVKGVVDGYEIRLEIEGIGYRAQLNGSDLVLGLGFSHPVVFKAPNGVAFKVEKSAILVSGADKALVGEVAAGLRALKKPEPYKGKGIRYAGEVIRRKAGKKATAGA